MHCLRIEIAQYSSSHYKVLLTLKVFARVLIIYDISAEDKERNSFKTAMDNKRLYDVMPLLCNYKTNK